MKRIEDIKQLIEDDGGLCRTCDWFCKVDKSDWPELGPVRLSDRETRQCTNDDCQPAFEYKEREIDQLRDEDNDLIAYIAQLIRPDIDDEDEAYDDCVNIIRKSLFSRKGGMQMLEELACTITYEYFWRVFRDIEDAKPVKLTLVK